jgi:hypothetical protein
MTLIGKIANRGIAKIAEIGKAISLGFFDHPITRDYRITRSFEA